jgi:hypothetical protein
MIIRISVAVAIALLFSPAVFAQEHPTGGYGGGQSTQPPSQRSGPYQPATSQQQGTTRGGKVTTADISAGIKSYIDGQAASAKDKKLHVTYGGKDLALALVRVHEDRLSNLGGRKYFACVDMKGADGNIYDIDFFLSGGTGNMRVTNASVHKVNGKPLYNWKEENGVWKKV